MKRMIVLTLTAAAFLGISASGVPVLAADEATSTQHCEDLVKQFHAADVSHVSEKKLEHAKEQAAHGEKLCKTNPKAGIKALDLALKDIGETPK
ncbi:MAG: hypothetical protein U1F76_23190 [Candidatus Competibacteraceae bacterium]